MSIVYSEYNVQRVECIAGTVHSEYGVGCIECTHLVLPHELLRPAREEVQLGARRDQHIVSDVLCEHVLHYLACGRSQ
jgi:hypothetical protein